MGGGRPAASPPSEIHHLKFLSPNDADYIPDWTVLATGESVYIDDKDAPELPVELTLSPIRANSLAPP